MFSGTLAYGGKYCLSIQFLSWNRVLTFDGKGAHLVTDALEQRTIGEL